MSLTRRDILRWAAAAAASAGYRPLWAAPGARWFKIGACEWSLGKADPTCFDLAKEIGVDGVQLNMGTAANGIHLRKPEVQQAYLAAANRTGLEIGPCLALVELLRVPLKSDPQAARWLAESIDVCKAMGMTMTMPPFFGRNELNMGNTSEIDHLVGVLKEIAPHAQRQGIAIALETGLNARDNLKIIQRVGSPPVKIYYDVGNSTNMGYDIYAEIRLLGGLICEMHAKDGGSLVGQGRIDFQRVRAALDDAGFSGWIHLETPHPRGLVRDYRAQHQFLRKLFPEGAKQAK